MQYPKLIESRTSGIEVSFIEWNPSMDLLATVFTNGLLTCSRLLSFQKKVWHKQSYGKIISIAWRPDGRVLAVGSYNEKTKENVCTLHDVENGNEINLIKTENAITSVSWFQFNQETQQNSLIQSGDEVKKFSHQLAHEQTRLNLLMISTDDGKVSFYALGLFCLGHVTVTEDNFSTIVATHLSGCFRFLTSIIHHKNRHSTIHSTSSLKIWKLNTLQNRSDEILRIAKLYARITNELEYLDDTINAITTSWADVLAGLDNKLSTYCSRKNNKHDTSRSGYTLLSADELLQLLVIGFPSDNLEKFLADMSDKGLKKLNNAIEQTCLRVQNLNVKNAQKCCYHLHGDLNLLRGMALWQERFREVGLDDKFIVEAMRSVGSLLLKLTELQQVTDHSLKSTKAFFRWLISIACRITGEQNNSVVPNDINKTTQQDIQLITSFINENFDYNSNGNRKAYLGQTRYDSPEMPGIPDDVAEFMDPRDYFRILRREEEEEKSLMTSKTLPGNQRRNDSNSGTNERPTCSNFTLEQVGQYLKNEPLSRLKYSFTKPESNFWIEFCSKRPELTEPGHLNADGSTLLLFYPHKQDTSLIQEHKSTCMCIADAFKSVAANIKLITDDVFIDLHDFIHNGFTNRIRVETDLDLMRQYTLFQLKQVLSSKQVHRVSRQYLVSQSLDSGTKTFKLISIEFKATAPGKPSAGSSKNNSDNLFITDSCFYENKDSRKMLLSFLLLDGTLNNTLMVQVELNKVLERCNTEKNLKDISKIFRSIDKYSTTVTVHLDITTEPAQERRQDLDAMVKKVCGTAGEDMFASSGRGVMAFTSLGNKRLHLYELENISGSEVIDDELEIDEKIDDSFIYTDMAS